MRLKWYYFLRMLFHLICDVFLAENKNIFKAGKKLENMKKQIIQKKRFHLSKTHFYQNGKAQKMPVVTGRFV